jgi:prepilin-type N-terminal cleavage/methylation domain-containing protein
VFQVARRFGFTLIELLIVVGIIAILAAIALPNFLEAQVRAKVARVRTDLRTMATAIESYTVDWNRPPFDGNPGDIHLGIATVQFGLTTPVTYITQVPADVFQDPTLGENPLPGQTYYVAPGRHAYDYSTEAWESNPTVSEGWKRNIGPSAWKIGSAGPDLRFVNDGSFFGQVHLYDPTNGTVSLGDIYRSQARK